jgi:hypothetical protein
MKRTFLVSIRGESYNNDDGVSRQSIIRRMRTNEPVQLKADPTNQHDRWAVKVLAQSGEQIGWLPSDARDADALLKGEPIQAAVHAVYGGTSWLKRLIGKKSVGVVLRITKGDPDWSRRAQLEDRAKKIDDQVSAALKIEQDGDIDAAIPALTQAIAAIRAFTTTDAYASAHRRLHAPVDRLSLLLERRKTYADALSLIQDWRTTFDPVQPSKSVVETLNKRAERLQSKLK